MTTVSLKDANNRLAALVREAEQGETVTITRNGEPVADIVIRVRPAGTLGARFDMRAESETGTRDFGRNLGLIKAYRAALAS